MADHGDALDFDLFDRWRVRLADVPSTVGWGAVALYLRHLPLDSATMRDMEPRALWSTEAHLLATIADLLVALLTRGKGEPIGRPGKAQRYADAAPVGADEYERVLARFRERKGATVE